MHDFQSDFIRFLNYQLISLFCVWPCADTKALHLHVTESEKLKPGEVRLLSPSDSLILATGAVKPHQFVGFDCKCSVVAFCKELHTFTVQQGLGRIVRKFIQLLEKLHFFQMEI